MQPDGDPRHVWTAEHDAHSDVCAADASGLVQLCGFVPDVSHDDTN